jgi:pyruvate dehydrogenase (quinone)
MIMASTVADVIVETLVSCGVKRIYGIPGDSIDPLVDAIRRNKNIQYVQGRHEEGSALEAAFEAKLTGMPVACMGTSGPGSIHLLNGLYEAKMDHVPVIALTGQVETDLIGHDYFQEVNINRLFEDVSIFNEQIVNPESAQYLAMRACHEAKVKGGVAHITLPVDILRSPSESKHVHGIAKYPLISYNFDPEEAVEAINQSQRPLLFIGRGSIGQSAQINDFAEKIGAPIIYALNAKGIMSDYDRKVMGGLGLLGSKASIDAMKQTDLLILIGTNFPYAAFIREDVATMQVESNPVNLKKRFNAGIDCLCTVSDFLNKVRPATKDEKFYMKLQQSKSAWISELEKTEKDSKEPMRPEVVSAKLSGKVKKDAVVVVDTGNVTVWGMRNFRTEEGKTFLFSPWLGSMGVGIPAAVGASFATDRQVVAMVGDGSFAMTMMELITARKYKRNVKIVVFNNSKLGMIKFEQEVMGYPEWGVDLLNPDFSKLAQAIGIYGRRVDKISDLDPAIDEFLSVESPGVLEVIVNPDEKPMPPKLTFSEIKGYVTSVLREALMEK